MADGDLLSGNFGDRLGRALADMQGLAAGFTTNAVHLGGRSNRVGGLPGFVSSYFDEQPPDRTEQKPIIDRTKTNDGVDLLTMMTAIT